jgi:DNA anti-recombination protein RmuC
MASNDEPRFSKIEEAIARLSNIASDLSKMLAVQDQRIQQQEKFSDSIGSLLEKRRDEVDKKFENVYKAIKDGDDTILDEMKKTAEVGQKQMTALDAKISKLEKWSWMVIGGAVALGYGISLIFNVLKLI